MVDGAVNLKRCTKCGVEYPAAMSLVHQYILITALGLITFWFADGDVLSESQLRAMLNELHIQGELPDGYEWSFYVQLPRSRRNMVTISLCGLITVHLIGRPVFTPKPMQYSFLSVVDNRWGCLHENT